MGLSQVHKATSITLRSRAEQVNEGEGEGERGHNEGREEENRGKYVYERGG